MTQTQKKNVQLGRHVFPALSPGTKSGVPLDALQTWTERLSQARKVTCVDVRATSHALEPQLLRKLCPEARVSASNTQPGPLHSQGAEEEGSRSQLGGEGPPRPGCPPQGESGMGAGLLSWGPPMQGRGPPPWHLSLPSSASLWPGTQGLGSICTTAPTPWPWRSPSGVEDEIIQSQAAPTGGSGPRPQQPTLLLSVGRDPRGWHRAPSTPGNCSGAGKERCLTSPPFDNPQVQSLGVSSPAPSTPCPRPPACVLFILGDFRV